jgi:cyclophilin family peptidyl-prolyl cis-trans isomerase
MRMIATAVAVLALALAGCGGGDDEKDNPESGGATPVGQQTGTDKQEQAEEQANGCTAAEEPAPKPDGGQDKPTEKLDEGTTYTLKVTTNCGEILMELDQKQSPNGVQSLVSLANNKFFDGTVFHRVVPGFVIQGGDPTGSGTGGPGYSTEDKPPSDAKYTKGVVAMAKTEAEPPGTAGSQFYIVSGEDAGLPPDYAIVGEVTDPASLETIAKIDALGQGDGPPSQPVVMESVTVEEG